LDQPLKKNSDLGWNERKREKERKIDGEMGKGNKRER
jgi:hypothetical protein